MNDLAGSHMAMRLAEGCIHLAFSCQSIAIQLAFRCHSIGNQLSHINKIADMRPSRVFITLLRRREFEMPDDKSNKDRRFG